MTPTAEDEWQRCLASIDIADRLAAIPIPSVAAREAYIACLHAANAYIFERTGDVPRTHKGVQAVFRRLCETNGEVALQHAAFFSRAYAYKEDSDYLDRRLVTVSELPEILAKAHALISAVQSTLGATRS